MATSPASSSQETMPLVITSLTTKAQNFYKGKIILVTGASGGLGQAFVFYLAQCGASKIIITGRDEKSLHEIARRSMEVISMNGKENTPKTTVHSLICDLSDLTAVEKMGEKALDICSTKGIDILINNGGISSRSPFIETKIEVDELLMKVNYLAGASLAKIVTPGMIKKGKGAIIWISSIQGLVGLPSRTSYAASKFAVQGYCEGLRAELASSGVSVHVASPGYIRTNLSRSAIQGNGSLYGKMDETTANGADPMEVAANILNGVSENKSDLIVAASFTARAAIWLRFLAPSLLQKMLVQRFDKSFRN